MDKILIITGPSSVGKSTYARKEYADWTIIESDGILWDKLSLLSENRSKKYPYKPIRKKIEEKIYHEMYNESLDKKKVVFVVNYERPLIDILDNEDIGYKIILIGSNLTRLVKNVNKRGNRTVGGVLLDYSRFFKPIEDDEEYDDSINIRRSSLDTFEKTTKKDDKIIEKFKTEFFPNDNKTNQIIPSIYYDYFVVIV